MEIRFSPEVTKTLKFIIENKWNVKIANQFINNIYKTIDSLEINPYLFPSTQVDNVRKAIVTKQTYFLYKISQNHIEILFFWDNG